jgi:hypothetical protein
MCGDMCIHIVYVERIKFHVFFKCNLFYIISLLNRVSNVEVTGKRNVLFQYIRETCFANIYAGALCKFTIGLIGTFCLCIFRRPIRRSVGLKLTYFDLYSFVLSFLFHGATAHSGAGPPYY